MATRSIVPINDNEGGIGSALKRWATGFFNALQSATHTITSFTIAGFVKNNASGVLSGGNSISADDLPSGIDAAKIGAGGVSSTVFGYLAGVTSALQAQIGGKLGLMASGLFTRDVSLASGSQTVSGVGFTPRLVFFFSGTYLVAHCMSVGIDNGVYPFAVADDWLDFAGVWEGYHGWSIRTIWGASVRYTGKISSFNSDGFVISWTKDGLPTGTCRVYYLALG